MPDTRNAHEVRIGTSGWNYPAPGYGPWTRVFYPVQTGANDSRHQTEVLTSAYYAEHFSTVEINNTFYRPPAVRTAESWARRTPPGFEFGLKLFQQFTHDRKVTGADVDTFKRGIEPLPAAPCDGAGDDHGRSARPRAVGYDDHVGSGSFVAFAFSRRWPACDVFVFLLGPAAHITLPCTTTIYVVC